MDAPQKNARSSEADVLLRHVGHIFIYGNLNADTYLDMLQDLTMPIVLNEGVCFRNSSSRWGATALQVTGLTYGSLTHGLVVVTLWSGLRGHQTLQTFTSGAPQGYGLSKDPRRGSSAMRFTKISPNMLRGVTRNWGDRLSMRHDLEGNHICFYKQCVTSTADQ